MNPGEIITFDKDVAINGAHCFAIDNCAYCLTPRCVEAKIKVGDPVFVLDGRNVDNEMITLISYDGGYYTIKESSLQDAKILVSCKLDPSVV